MLINPKSDKFEHIIDIFIVKKRLKINKYKQLFLNNYNSIYIKITFTLSKNLQ